MSTWFERLTGFRETSWSETRSRFEVRETTLHSRVDGRSWSLGEYALPSLAELRARVAAGNGPAGRLRVGLERGDVLALHREPRLCGALFQVASQFNLLEMTSPEVTPEDGVTRYETDGTQGPRCAMAAGAATIFRNYFLQTRDRQVDALADLGAALGNVDERLWQMRNGYALCTDAGLCEIGARLATAGVEEVDALRGLLRVGVHRDADVTYEGAPVGQRVSQVFCSALPVSYGGGVLAHWEAFATLVLEATYEATLLEGLLQARRGLRTPVLLTLVGGGVFGNQPSWIERALRRALTTVAETDLDVRVVSYGEPPDWLAALIPPPDSAMVPRFRV
jgi:hypothetical protein